MTKQRSQTKTDLIRFALAGTSNMTAATITNPIDVIKVRMQLDNELKKSSGHLDILRSRYYRGFFAGLLRIVHDEGIRGWYRGLLASVMREGSYSTIRLGAYEPIKRLFGATDPAHTPLWKKLCSGAISGSIGSCIATPTDLVKVRMQSQRVEPGQPLRYPSTFGAFRQIWNEGRFRALYVGVGPTVKRAAILSATQIPAYDHTKHTLLNYGLFSEGIPLHITSSILAGFMTACTTSPVDVVKTRIMNQKTDGNSRLYRNAFDCVLQTIRSEGILGLYKGFIPNWMRIGPHTLITFFVFEQLRKLAGLPPV